MPCGQGWRYSRRPPIAEAFNAAPRHDGFNVRVGMHTGGVCSAAGSMPRTASAAARSTSRRAWSRRRRPAPAHQPRHLPPGARRVRCGGAAADRRSRGWMSPSSPTWCRGPSRARSVVASRGIEGVETRMVGRDAELEQLQEAFKRVYPGTQVDRRHCGRRAGIGKSRLLYEFENWAEARLRGLQHLPGPGAPADRGPALRSAARHPGLAAADCRQRQHGSRQAEDRAGHCAVIVRRWRRHGTGPRPFAGPPDWTRLRREPAHQRHQGRRQADPKPGLPRGGADVPPYRGTRRHAHRAAARRSALGGRRIARLPQLPGPGQPRRADAAARPCAPDAVRAAVRLEQHVEAPPAHRSDAPRQGCQPPARQRAAEEAATTFHRRCAS